MELPVRESKDKWLADIAGERVGNYFEKIEKRAIDPLASKYSQDDDMISDLTSPRSQAGTAAHSALDLARKVQLLSVGEGSPSGASLSGSSLNRDLVLAKLNKEKVLSLIKAWEENMKKKSLNSYSKKVAKVCAWEAAQRAKAEAALRTSEESLENEKAACIERTQNKVALVHRIAEEHRALAEAHHGEKTAKVEEIAAKCRASGCKPRKSIFCF